MSFEYKGATPNEKKGITRRGFLKAGLAFGTALVGGRVVDDYLTEKKETGAGVQEKPNLEKDKPASKDTETVAVTPEQEEIYREDMESVESIADILDFDNKEPIRLTPEKMEGVKNYWKQRYDNKKDNLHNDLVKGYKEWGCWRPYTEHEFKDAGIPIRYALLALPESHWDVNARSEAGAVGPYQFMPKTAVSFNLKTDRFIDERRDPIRSSAACALVLRELYRASGDWDVALSGYNGGFAWKFIKEAKSKGQTTSYGNFLKYLEEKLNKIKDNLHTNKRFGKLSHEAKREIFAQKISGFCQNLNYPPKFHAVEELIKEGKVHEQKQPIKFKEEKIIQTEATPIRIEHVVAHGENLFKIARKLNIPPQELYRYNRKLASIKKLKAGDRLEIPPNKKIKKGYLPGSLLDKAKKIGKSEKEIRFLNPHILDVERPLSKGTKYRV